MLPHMRFGRPGLPLLWMLATSLGWALAPFTPLQTTFRTYAEIVRQAPMYALVGLLLGVTTGLGQALVWKLQGRPAAQWWWATACGFGLALPLGLVAATVLPTFFSVLLSQDPSGFLPWTEPGGAVFWPLPTALALCGGIVGLAQWLVLRQLISQIKVSMALLWVFGVWLSLSLGMYLGALTRQWAESFGPTIAVPGLIGRAAAGAAIGLFTSILLSVLLREAQPLSNQSFARPA